MSASVCVCVCACVLGNICRYVFGVSLTLGNTNPSYSSGVRFLSCWRVLRHFQEEYKKVIIPAHIYKNYRSPIVCPKIKEFSNYLYPSICSIRCKPRKVKTCFAKYWSSVCVITHLHMCAWLCVCARPYGCVWKRPIYFC